MPPCGDFATITAGAAAYAEARALLGEKMPLPQGLMLDSNDNNSPQAATSSISTLNSQSPYDGDSSPAGSTCDSSETSVNPGVSTATAATTLVSQTMMMNNTRNSSSSNILPFWNQQAAAPQLPLPSLSTFCGFPYFGCAPPPPPTSLPPMNPGSFGACWPANCCSSAPPCVSSSSLDLPTPRTPPVGYNPFFSPSEFGAAVAAQQIPPPPSFWLPFVSQQPGFFNTNQANNSNTNNNMFPSLHQEQQFKEQQEQEEYSRKRNYVDSTNNEVLVVNKLSKVGRGRPKATDVDKNMLAMHRTALQHKQLSNSSLSSTCTLLDMKVATTAAIANKIIDDNPHNKKKLSRVPWTPEEDQHLEQMVKNFGNRWAAVSATFPNRTRDQCRERWRTFTDPKRANRPHVKRIRTPEEEQALMEQKLMRQQQKEQQAAKKQRK